MPGAELTIDELARRGQHDGALASELLLASFQLAMTDAAEVGFEREVAALGVGGSA